jgi:hypothetical protein
MFRNTVALQFPLFPYLKDPFMLAGVKNLPVIRENQFQPTITDEKPISFRCTPEVLSILQVRRPFYTKCLLRVLSFPFTAREKK